MLLSEILCPDCIKVPVTAGDKIGAITEMVDLVDAAGRLSDHDLMLRTALQREQTSTTGIGNGLAVPHGKCSAVSELVMAVGKPACPIDFESIDGKNVTVIIFLASPPDRTGPHIQALARISRLMSDPKFRQALESARLAEEIFSLFKDYENGGEK